MTSCQRSFINNLPSSTDYISIPRRNGIIVSGISVKKKETCRDLKRSFEKNIVKDMGENSKEEFDFEYDKIHRHGKVNGTKQNVIARFRSHQYPSDLYYARKKLRTAI